MSALEPLTIRLGALGERLDALSLRERGLIFLAGATLIFIAWQTLLMGPLTAREISAEQRLTEARHHLADLEQLGFASASDPQIAAAARNRALKDRLAALDSELQTTARGYVSPQQMTDLLRQLLAAQQGLKLLSLANLPVESLSGEPALIKAGGKVDDIGPFLHPVEVVVEGDYASLVVYLRALEGMPWQTHWQRLELTAAAYPVNRVRIVVGALSLSRDWINL
jgi:MSHA biogenesis protein MshJ